MNDELLTPGGLDQRQPLSWEAKRSRDGQVTRIRLTSTDLESGSSRASVNLPNLFTTNYSPLLRASLIAFSLLFVATPAHAQSQFIAKKTIENGYGGNVEIQEWTDGLRRNKYVVMTPGGLNHWFSQTGSANSGAGDINRPTSKNEWCRVRYLYGDDVRVPECWGEFMYSNHLITGVDGMHYELWFSPSSLSYFKVRNQELGIWYAHDGSANDGGLRTTKEDWCRL